MTAQEFEMVYDAHFDSIRRYLIYRSGDRDLSSDIAQNVFMKVWTKKMEVANGNIKSLLYKMAGEDFISHLRHKKVEINYINTLDFKIINEEEDADFSAIFSVGDQIEFCGCYVNIIAKTMDVKELVKLGLDIMSEGDGLNEEITDAQFDILFNNEKILDGLLSCMVKVLE